MGGICSGKATEANNIGKQYAKKGCEKSAQAKRAKHWKLSFLFIHESINFHKVSVWPTSVSDMRSL